MLPHDLTSTRLALPPGDRASAVLITGDLPRHLRLGYLLQRRFPGLLRRWWTCEASARELRAARLRQALALLRPRARRAGRLRWLLDAALAWAARDDLGAVERRMFGPEIEALSASATVHPTISGPGDRALCAEIEAISPYFALVFDGPPLGDRVLGNVRGLAIRQHSGWAPALKGTQTVETALYYRRLEWVGTTIHLMETPSGAGAILRRSTAALHPDDSVAHCLLAVIAAGNHMLCEVVSEARAAAEVLVFPQPRGGQTIDGLDHCPARRRAVARDFRRGWFEDAVLSARSF